MSHEKYQPCIDACIQCAQECDHCASACLGEAEVEMLAQCIRLDHDCATICWTAASYMSRGSQFAVAVCRLCAEICDACAEECGKHAAHMEHCARCAEACRRCAETCRQMATV